MLIFMTFVMVLTIKYIEKGLDKIDFAIITFIRCYAIASYLQY